MSISEDDIKEIIRKTYEISKNVERGELWSSLANRFGDYYYYEKEDPDEPFELEYYEEESMVEDYCAICKNKKDGKLYIKTLYDYALDKLRKEEIEEPTEDMIYEYIEGICDKGECNPPKDICGDDEYIGDIHTHPNYSISPSCKDLEYWNKMNFKVACIASKDTFACLFMDKESTIPCRSSDFYSKLCISAKVTKEDILGNIIEETYNLCPKEFLDGFDNAYINEVRRLVREGKLKGVCFKTTDNDEILCDFGDKIIGYKIENNEVKKIRELVIKGR